LIQQAEKQRQVSNAMNVKFEAKACAMQKQGYNPIKKDFKRGKSDKRDKYCTHCKVKGHSTDGCFKIHRYPEWYKQKYGAKLAAQVSTEEINNFKTPLHLNKIQENVQPNLDSAVINAVCQEVLKALKSQQAITGSGGSSNSSFTGNVILRSSCTALTNNVMMNNVKWMVDTGASDHMTPHAHLSTSLRRSEKSIVVSFLDGHTRRVNYVGDIVINSELELKDVLYVPKFKHSLLSVSKLLNDHNIATSFLAHKFLLQDPIIKKNLAKGRQVGGLYKLEANQAKGYQV